MLGYTIQVGKPVPQAGLVAQAILPVPTYPRTSATDPCLEQQLRSFRRFAPPIRPRNLPAAPPQLVLQSLHASEHASGPLALLRRHLPRLMAHRPPGLPRIRRRNVHRFRCLWRHGSLAPMEDAPRPLADRFRDRLRFDDDDLRPCILPPLPTHQIT